MIDFEYHSPVSLEETFDLLDRHGEDARVMAGGTALVLQMKHRFSRPGHVISLRRVTGLDSIILDGGGIGAAAGYEQDCAPGSVRVGALCTQRRIETDPIIVETLPLVAETFSRVATPRIRNMGTIGGGLVHGDPNQDPPPALIALGASVTMSSSKGERVLPVEELFIDYYETDVRPGEVLTSVSIPPAPPGSGSCYIKFLPRTADDYATVSVAALVEPSEDNMCRSIRIVLGSVGVTPVRAVAAESMLQGQELTDSNIRACAGAVREAVDPLEDFRGSPEYKTDMAEVFTRRAIERALANVG